MWATLILTSFKLATARLTALLKLTGTQTQTNIYVAAFVCNTVGHERMIECAVKFMHVVRFFLT